MPRSGTRARDYHIGHVISATTAEEMPAHDVVRRRGLVGGARRNCFAFASINACSESRLRCRRKKSRHQVRSFESHLIWCVITSATSVQTQDFDNLADIDAASLFLYRLLPP